MEAAWEIPNGFCWSKRPLESMAIHGLSARVMSGEDFKEKGAVGAVKDAVADAGDILIDGVSGCWGQCCGKRGRGNQPGKL